MNIWLIEPRDPLIARDGKPIGGDASIETLPFPFPSTMAGATRTRMASSNGEFLFVRNDAALKELLTVPVAGPVLTEVDGATGVPKGFYYPAPRDAVVRPVDPNDTGKGIKVQRLEPGRARTGSEMDSLASRGLRPIEAEGGESTEKPFAKAPAYWNQASFLDWLKTAKLTKTLEATDELGVEPLPTETRVHVVMREGERVGVDGGLFQTKGLRFSQEQKGADGQAKLGQTRHWALSIRTQPQKVANIPLDLRNELAPLGGERRLARWRRSTEMQWPSLPVEIRNAVKRTKTARVVLLTPAMFTHGALPGWSGEAWPLGGGLKVTVEAACVGRPEIVSGWDLAVRNPNGTLGGPKPTRRLAPAGSVYFVRLGDEKTSEASIEEWLERTWLACVSDAERDQLDGFGLAMVGVWEEGS